MRILFFSHYFPPEGNAPASRTYENAQRWVKAGHEVTVITCAPNCPDGVVYEGFRNWPVQHEMVNGIKVIRVWTFIAANKGSLRRILNYVSYMLSAVFFSLFVKRPDVMIATSPQFFCGWAGVLCRFFRRVPFILEIRDIWPESIVAVGAMKNSRTVSLLEWLEKKMYAASAHIVTVGDGYKRRLMERGVSEEKISVIMNGVNRDLFEPRPGDAVLKDRLGLDGTFVCSYSGTLGMACGLDVVLDAARKLRERNILDVTFLLVGDGAFREELERKAADQGLDNIVFTGRQPKESMPGFLAISDVCLVHLRKTELFTTVMPSKMFEAAGMERPIINGVSGFAATFLKRAGAGVNIEPENSEQLIDALMMMKAAPDICRAYGKSGRDYVITHFDRDKLALDYLTVIEGVLQGIEEVSQSTAPVLVEAVAGGGTFDMFPSAGGATGFFGGAGEQQRVLPREWKPERAVVPDRGTRYSVRPALLVVMAVFAMFLYRWRDVVGESLSLLWVNFWHGGIETAVRTYGGSGTFWVTLLGCFMGTAVLTPMVMWLARKVGAMDHGGGRKVHKGAMPLLGGLAVAVPFLGICVLGLLGATDLFGHLARMQREVLAIMAGSLLILALGIIDDVWVVRYQHKLFFQALAVACICAGGGIIHVVQLPGLSAIHVGMLEGVLLTFLWVASITNAFNLIDGLDGLAAGVGLIVLLALAVIAAMNGATFTVLLCAALVGSLLAFLLYNFHPARIFLGDTGSLFLGFAVAVVSLMGSMKTTGAILVLVPVLALGFPVFEVVVSFFRRWVRKIPISQADAWHTHHRLVKMGFTHRRAVVLLYGCTLVGLLAALVTATLPGRSMATLVPIVFYGLFALAVGWYVGYGRDFRGIFRTRKIASFYNIFSRYTALYLSHTAGDFTVSTVLEWIRREFGLGCLEVCFLEPVESIGRSQAEGVEPGCYGGEWDEVVVKTRGGERVRVRYAKESVAGEQERYGVDVRQHLGRIFKEAKIRRPGAGSFVKENKMALTEAQRHGGEEAQRGKQAEEF